MNNDSNNAHTATQDLTKIRVEINQIDAGILELLQERTRLSLEVARIKADIGKPILDEAREAELLQNIKSRIENSELKDQDEHLLQIWGKILDMSRDVQTKFHNTNQVKEN